MPDGNKLRIHTVEKKKVERLSFIHFYSVSLTEILSVLQILAGPNPFREYAAHNIFSSRDLFET